MRIRLETKITITSQKGHEIDPQAVAKTLLGYIVGNARQLELEQYGRMGAIHEIKVAHGNNIMHVIVGADMVIVKIVVEVSHGATLPDRMIPEPLMDIINRIIDLTSTTNKQSTGEE